MSMFEDSFEGSEATIAFMDEKIKELRAASAEMMAAYQEYTRYLVYGVPKQIEGFDAAWERLEKAKAVLKVLLKDE